VSGTSPLRQSKVETKRERLHLVKRLDDLGGAYEGDWCGLALDLDVTVEIEGYRLRCTACGGEGAPNCLDCEGSGWDVLWQATSARTVEVHNAVVMHEDAL
jgi:hypothetical protein